jgi:peptide/nickel transport system substrate-binding protein
LRLAFGGTALTLAAACSPLPAGAPVPSPPTPAPPAAATSSAITQPAPAAGSAAQPADGQPRAGGTLRGALTQDLTTLDGHVLIAQNNNTVGQIYDRLIAYDEAMQPQPMLAERWDVSDDSKRVKLTLRQGVQFHTGRELTSDDVKWNVLRVRDPKTGAGQLATQSAWFSRIETPDKYTVELSSDKPRPGIYDFFEYFNILNPVTMEGPAAKSSVVGTGPFKFVEFQQGVVFRMVKNPSYWQAGRPLLDEVVVQILPDQQTLAAQLEAGSVDFADPGIRDALRLTQTSAFVFVDNPNPSGGTVLNVNTTRAPTNDKRVRQGLQYAVDRQRFVNTAQLGLGRAVSLPWPPRSPAYEPDRATFYPFDLDKARALFAQAGLAEFELDFQYQAPVTTAAQLGQILQSDLARIGVKLNLRPLEPAAWRAAAEGLQYHGLNATSNGFTQLGEASSMFSLGRSWAPTGNNAGYNNETYAGLIEAASSEPDPARRKLLYTQLNDLLLDESFGIVVATSPNSTVYRANLRGITYSVNGSLRLGDVWLSAET